MYHLSRAIYRDIAPLLPPGGGQRAAVLRACEHTIERLAADPHYFARPARALFLEIRGELPLRVQGEAWRIIRRHVERDAELLRQRPDLCDLGHAQPACQATTRRGSHCQREPLPGSRYCPSHQHLAETEEQPLRVGRPLVAA